MASSIYDYSACVGSPSSNQAPLVIPITPERRRNRDLALVRLNGALAERYLPLRAQPDEWRHVPLRLIAEITGGETRRSKRGSCWVSEREVEEMLPELCAWEWRTVLVGDGVFGDPETYLIYRPRLEFRGVAHLMPPLVNLSGPQDRAAALLVAGTVLKAWLPDGLDEATLARLCGLEGHRGKDTGRIVPGIRKALDRLQCLHVLDACVPRSGEWQLTWAAPRHEAFAGRCVKHLRLPGTKHLRVTHGTKSLSSGNRARCAW